MFRSFDAKILSMMFRNLTLDIVISIPRNKS